MPQTFELQRSRLTALVDGKLRYVREVVQRPPDPISVVVAIDVSGSMIGGPIEAARQAALDLVDRLNSGDQVAVIAFSDEPTVISDFTITRSSTVEAINSVFAGGSTALYGAVGSAADPFEQADTDERVLVLLSDGLDSGASVIGRDASINAIMAAGASVYSFALQLQGEVDVGYLGTLAGRTGGEFSEVAGEQALGALFASLGQRLGADVAVTIEVAPLMIGQHGLTLQFAVGAARVESEFEFEVENSGLIATALAEPPAPRVGEDGQPEALKSDGAIIVRIDSPVDLHLR